MTDERTVNHATSIVKDAGGYISFDDYDKAYRDKPVFMPMVTFAGWGNPIDLEHNNGVVSAVMAVDAGKLVREDNGYRLADSVEQS